MQYKTIVLELLREDQTLHEQLRRSGTLLQTMEHYAVELKCRHDYWKDHLSQAQPESDHYQITSKALELAIQDLRDALPAASSPSAIDPEEAAAIAFLLRPIPPA